LRFPLTRLSIFTGLSRRLTRLSGLARLTGLLSLLPRLLSRRLTGLPCLRLAGGLLCRRVQLLIESIQRTRHRLLLGGSGGSRRLLRGLVCRLPGGLRRGLACW
jgi:hypothetical protein